MILVIATFIVGWGYYLPKRHLFVCAGLEVERRILKEQGNDAGEWSPKEKVVRVYEYFWGLDYSINEWSRNDCSIRPNKHELVCSNGAFDRPTEYRWEEFDLDTGKFSYTGVTFNNLPREKNATRHSGYYFGCRKTSRAVDN